MDTHDFQPLNYFNLTLIYFNLMKIEPFHNSSSLLAFSVKITHKINVNLRMKHNHSPSMNEIIKVGIQQSFPVNQWSFLDQCP